MVGGRRPLLPEILGQTDWWSENADLQSIFAHSASAITRSETCSINTDRKSTMRFPMSLRWTLYVCLQRGLRNAKRLFSPRKIALHLKKECYKVSLCEYCRRQSCKAFTGLSLRAKMVLTTWQFDRNWPTPFENADFQSIIARSSSAITPSKKSSINNNRKSFQWA